MKVARTSVEPTSTVTIVPFEKRTNCPHHDGEHVSEGVSWGAEEIPLTSRQRVGSISHHAKHLCHIDISSICFEGGERLKKWGERDRGGRVRERERKCNSISLCFNDSLLKQTKTIFLHSTGTESKYESILLLTIVVRDVLLSHYDTDLPLDNSAWVLTNSGPEMTIMATQQSRTFQLQDLLSNAGDGKDDENLSVNDGHVGTYIEEHKIFITMPNGSFIPHPPTAMEILLHKDGRFGHHDPTRAPQFFDAKFCHFSVIPRCPGPKDDTHPYRNWLDTIWYDVVDADIVYLTGYLTHIGLLSWEVHSRFQHAFNYIDECSSATRSSKQFSEEFNGFLGIRCACLEALQLFTDQ
ncbi:hypothetical protein IW262DRAFT_1302752 [Armillaria fumosa]|nr:hypothetical protein IW262DRAFT_1302752 [Armillaria fumosa]